MGENAEFDKTKWSKSENVTKNSNSGRSRLVQNSWHRTATTAFHAFDDENKCTYLKQIKANIFDNSNEGHFETCKQMMTSTAAVTAALQTIRRSSPSERVIHSVEVLQTNKCISDFWKYLSLWHLAGEEEREQETGGVTGGGGGQVASPSPSPSPSQSQSSGGQVASPSSSSSLPLPYNHRPNHQHHTPTPSSQSSREQWQRYEEGQIVSSLNSSLSLILSFSLSLASSFSFTTPHTHPYADSRPHVNATEDVSGGRK